MPLVVQTLALQFGRMSCLSSLDGYEVVADAVFISINTAFPVQTCIWCLGRRTCISVSGYERYERTRKCGTCTYPHNQIYGNSHVNRVSSMQFFFVNKKPRKTVKKMKKIFPKQLVQESESKDSQK